jgi:hypothetical protein
LEGEVFSFGGGVSVGSENTVEGGEGTLGPDDESAELTSGGEFQKVQSVDVGNSDSWDVTESGVEFGIFSSDDDQGTFTGGVSIVSPFSFSTSDGTSVDDSFYVFEGANSLQPSDGISGAVDAFDGIVENEG